MEELEITEDFEKQAIYLKTDKRKERIKIYVPWDGFATWKISYENGKPVPGLKGAYLSRKQAIEAVRFWLKDQKMSEDAKHDAWFGPDQKKTLKRKANSGAKTKTVNS